MRWLSFAAILFYCTSGEAATLTIGRVHENPSRAYKEVKPIVDYAASRLKDLGLTEGSVVVAKDREEMIKFIAEGKVDWTTDSIVSGLLYTQKTGAEILLRRWAGGVPTYYSVMFTRNDSKINFLKDLQGKKIAFQNPGSTTAYYIPVATLRKAVNELADLAGGRLSSRRRAQHHDLGPPGSGRRGRVSQSELGQRRHQPGRHEERFEDLLPIPSLSENGGIGAKGSRCQHQVQAQRDSSQSPSRSGGAGGAQKLS